MSKCSPLNLSQYVYSLPHEIIVVTTLRGLIMNVRYLFKFLVLAGCMGIGSTATWSRSTSRQSFKGMALSSSAVIALSQFVQPTGRSSYTDGEHFRLMLLPASRNLRKVDSCY